MKAVADRQGQKQSETEGENKFGVKERRRNKSNEDMG